MPISLPTILLGSLVIFFAFYTRALFGFGGALISIPLLVFFLPLKFAVPLEAIFEVVLSFLLIKGEVKNINFKILIPIVIGSIVGTFLGTYVLKSFANAFLLKALGVVIILFAFNLLQKSDTKSKILPNPIGFLAGITGGTLGGIFGTSGPPFVLYLAYQVKQKDILRGTLIGLFTFDFTFRLGFFLINGLVTYDILLMALYLTPALVLGMLLGKRHFVVISEEKYRILVFILLLITGLLQVIK